MPFQNVASYYNWRRSDYDTAYGMEHLHVPVFSQEKAAVLGAPYCRLQRTYCNRNGRKWLIKKMDIRHAVPERRLLL
jgi:hypothetical protein